jgi:tetratricopeptide (TPR) repeat protein
MFVIKNFHLVKLLNPSNQPFIFSCLLSWFGIVTLHGSEISQPQFQTKEDSLYFYWDKAKQKKDIQSQINYIDALCVMYRYESSWKKHDSVTKELLDLGLRENNRDAIAEAYNYMGISSALNGDIRGSIAYFKKTLDMNIEIQDSSAVSNMMENIGMVYQDMAMYDSAMHYYMGSMRIREEMKHKRLFNTYTDIAILYRNIKDVVNLEKYLLKAQDILKSTADTNYHNMAMWHNSWAGLLKEKDISDSLEYHYSKVYDYSEKANWKNGMTVASGNLAQLYYDNGEVERSLEKHLQVLELSKEFNMVMGVAEQNVLIGQIYLEIGEINKALAFAHDALEISHNHNFQKFKRDALGILHKAYEKKNSINKAYGYHKQYVVLKDSLFNIEKMELISDMESRYETEKKDQQIELLYSENQVKNQQIQMGVVLMAFLLMGAFATYLYFFTQKRQAKLVEVGLQHKLSRAQLNPHFLSNAMASIQKYVSDHDAESAGKYLGKFSMLNRSVLEHSMVESISLGEEIDMLSNYLEFEQLRLGNAFTFKIEMDAQLDTEMIYIPPLFIQPFVENAIKHGVKDRQGDGMITIRFADLTNMIKVEVIDNGKGLQKEKTDKTETKSSRSLMIIKKRLHLLRKKYRKLPDLSVVSLAQEKGPGVIVTIHLPII